MTPLLFIRRDVLKLTQSEMAAVTGVSQSTVSKWEAGQSEPGRQEMQRIREDAKRRRIPWHDEWFFASPPSGVAPLEQAEPEQVAAASTAPVQREVA